MSAPLPDNRFAPQNLITKNAWIKISPTKHRLSQTIILYQSINIKLKLLFLYLIYYIFKEKRCLVTKKMAFRLLYLLSSQEKSIYPESTPPTSALSFRNPQMLPPELC